MIYMQLYMEIDHIQGQAETANSELLRISSLLVHESKEKEKATREVHQANQLLTDRQQQIEVLQQVYTETSAKLTQTSQHSRTLLRDLEVAQEMRARLEGESRTLRDALSMLRSACTTYYLIRCAC
jgi:chromosome segregation ATPase